LQQQIAPYCFGKVMAIGPPAVDFQNYSFAIYPCDTVEIRGSKTFPDHVPLQHFNRRACTPKFFWQKG